MIDIQGLTKTYGGLRALDKVSFRVEPGSVFGLLGPNGSGKSTLLHAIMRICRPSSGHIVVDGAGADPRRCIAWMPQRRVPYPGYTVRELCFFNASFFDDADPEQAVSITTEYGVGANTRVDSLSQGSQTKVFLAMALARRPKWFLFDEPFEGLDPQSHAAVLAHLAAATGPDRAGAVLATHRLETVERICDTIGVLREGRLVHAGSLDDLLESWRSVTFWTSSIDDRWTAHPSIRSVDSSGVSVQLMTDDHIAFLADIGQPAAADVHPLRLTEIYLALTRSEVAA